jgi:hypothetical protein
MVGGGSARPLLGQVVAEQFLDAGFGPGRRGGDCYGALAKLRYSPS